MDEQGRARIELGKHERGNDKALGVRILDEDGEERAVLSLGVGGSWLTLREKDSEVWAQLRSISGSSAGLIKDEDGRATLVYFVEQAELILAGKDGRARLSSSDDGGELILWGREPAINIYGKGKYGENKKRAVLGSTSLEITKTGTKIKRSPASLVLFDKEGKVLWQTPTD